jgi:hypothetical protein
MSTSTTGFGVSQRIPPSAPPFPPFPAGAANNGLSVDPVTGLIVLGNNTGGALATLLSNRDIPLNGKVLNFTGLAVQMHLNDGGALPDILFGDAAGINILQIVPALQLGFWNATDGTDLASITLVGQPGAASAQIGASNATGGSSINVQRFVIDVNCNTGFSINNITNNAASLTINTATHLVKIGDVTPSANSTLLTINDVARTVTINAVSGLFLVGDTVLLHTLTSLANGAGASIGTLTNAPAAGNPTKWITINDNGTPRQIPAW